MDSEVSINKKTSEYLWKIGNILSTSCAAASRFYLCNLERYLAENSSYLKISSKRAHLYCNHCGSLFSCENSVLRFHSCPTINKHIKKLLKLESEQPWRLNNRQKKKIKKFCEATNKIVYTCLICNKKSTILGDRRNNHLSQTADRSISQKHPKVKIKKGDLNAGLFISCKSKDKDVSVDTKITEATVEIPIQNDSMNITTPLPGSAHSSVLKHETNLFKYQIASANAKAKTPNTASKTEKCLTAKKKKKRKTLLDEILKKEQERKAKPGLASFLLSL